jgi:endo-1,4-beta-xylanase
VGRRGAPLPKRSFSFQRACLPRPFLHKIITTTNFEDRITNKDQVKTIRQLSKKKFFGSAVQYSVLKSDKKYRSILEKQYNILTPENEMKFPIVHPDKYIYDFSIADKIVAFAEKHHQKIHGHTLVWGHRIPAWLQNGHFSQKEMLAILEGHIKTVVGHFKGKIYAWDVVNEALNNNGTFKDNIWLRSIGPQYIALSFIWAHEADPKAILLYNDYGIEQINKKSSILLNYLSSLKSKGIPINGVGMQTHTSIYSKLNYSKIKSNIDRFGDSGFIVNVTELDISIKGNEPIQEREEKQAKLYRDIYKACLKSKNCTSVTTWGFTDRYTWEKPEDAPLLYYKNFREKSAYKNIIKLRERKK